MSQILPYLAMVPVLTVLVWALYVSENFRAGAFAISLGLLGILCWWAFVWGALTVLS